MDKVFDLIIVGAGSSAWTAATFLARAGISTLVTGLDEQSGLADAADVKNYPGFPEGISGRVLLDNFIEQGMKQGAEFVREEVVHAALRQAQGENSGEFSKDRMFLVRTASRKEFFAKNLILAHGANYIKANLPGEKQYAGKGVHYCALCDGPLYRNKDIVVLGNGNLAAEEAVELLSYAKNVQIVSHSPNVNFSPEYSALLKEKSVRVATRRVKKISGGDTRAHSITLDDGSTLSLDALFISFGVASSQIFSQKLGLVLAGDFIKTDENMRTSVDGIWAVGMARGGVNQIVKSVGDGGIAAVDAIKKIKGLPSYVDQT
ncbi:MAG: FAD-dependent oxidoreductase [Patescibacteria group bacterium]